MRWGLFVLTALVAALLFSNRCHSERPADPDKPDPGNLRPGMSQAEVLRMRGPPKHMARQILYRRYLEQWVYEGPDAVRIEFDCVRGKEPQILTVHPLTVPRP
jgi:hypothetical protein